MRTTAIRLFLGLAPLFLFGCTEEPPTQAFLLDGFGFRWEKRPHRVNKLGVKLGDMIPYDKGLLGRSCATLEGGSWATGEEGSDSANHCVAVTALSSSKLRFHHGQISELKLWGSKTAPAEATETITLALDSIALSGCTQFAVLLRGFDLDTDLTHEFGYTVQGMAAGVGQANLAASTLRFTVRLRIVAGEVPDRSQKLAKYGATGRVYYTVVGLVNGVVTGQNHGYTLVYAPGIFPLQPSASNSQQAVTIQGAPGFNLATVGLTEFDFTLNSGESKYPGRYLREIRVRNHDFSYEASTGVMKFKCDGLFSNSGGVSWGLKNSFRAGFVLLQVSDPNGRLVRLFRTEEQNETEICTPLSVEYGTGYTPPE